MGRGGCRDGLGITGFVAAARRVTGGKSKGTLMGNAKGVAAVGAGVNLGGVGCGSDVVAVYILAIMILFG